MYLALTLAILKHEVTRKYVLRNVLYPSVTLVEPPVSIILIPETSLLSFESLFLLNKTKKIKIISRTEKISLGGSLNLT